MRFIIRPNSISKTPRQLKTALGARNTVKLENVVSCDYNQDLFLAYPEPSKVINKPGNDYSFLHNFYQSNKATQRTVLAGLGLPIVPLFGLEAYSRFVVRPLRHRQGLDYRVTEDRTDYSPATHYISALIPKLKEYRYLCYKGKHVCTYFKAQNPDQPPVSSDLPWTHANGFRFLTILHAVNDKVTTSGLADKILGLSLTKTASLIAYDVLATRDDLYVCEANLCPGLSIPNTISKIAAIESELSAR